MQIAFECSGGGHRRASVGIGEILAQRGQDSGMRTGLAASGALAGAEGRGCCQSHLLQWHQSRAPRAWMYRVSRAPQPGQTASAMNRR